MSAVAERLSMLLKLHGHSYRDAAEICGVDHTTVLRVARGETENPATLQRITEGYGIPMAWLRGDRDVAMDFACHVIARPMRERVLFFWESRRRLGFALTFLLAYAPARFTAQWLGEVLELDASQLKDALDGPPAPVTQRALERLASQTGLSETWLRTGLIGCEDEEQMMVGMAEWALTTLAADLGIQMDPDEAHAVAVNLI